LRRDRAARAQSRFAALFIGSEQFLNACADLLDGAEFAAVKPLQTSAYLAAEPCVVIDVLLNHPLNVLIRPSVDFRGRAVELGLHFRSEMDLHRPSVAPAESIGAVPRAWDN
jgi:hypothetical protein